MIDLTKIQKPFGLLSPKTQKRLIAHRLAGGTLHLLGQGGWRDIDKDAHIHSYITYRAKPDPEPTKPDAPWEFLPKWATCIAADKSGRMVCYELRPEMGVVCWRRPGGRYLEITDLQGVTPGTCDWRESLVERPQ
jgi:hypothetical protein